MNIFIAYLTAIIFGMVSFTFAGTNTSDHDEANTQSKPTVASCVSSIGYNDNDFTDGASAALLMTCNVEVYEVGSTTVKFASTNTGDLKSSDDNTIAYTVAIANADDTTSADISALNGTTIDLSTERSVTLDLSSVAIKSSGITVTGEAISALPKQMNGAYSDTITLTVIDQL